MEFKKLSEKNRYYQDLLLPIFKETLLLHSVSSFKYHYRKFDYLFGRDGYVEDEVMKISFKAYLKIKYNIQTWKNEILTMEEKINEKLV